MLKLITACAAIVVAMSSVPAHAYHRHHHHHHRHHHRGHHHYLDANGNVASPHIVTRETKMGPIKVAPDFGDKVVGLINDMADQGLQATVHCWNHARSHVRRSNHYTGHACDFNGSGNRWSPMNRRRMASLIHAHGLRDGCDFGDCGHVDDAKNVGGVTRWDTVMAARRTYRVARHHHRRHHRYYYARA